MKAGFSGLLLDRSLLGAQPLQRGRHRAASRAATDKLSGARAHIAEKRGRPRSTS